MGKLSADKSRNSDKKNSTSDENARKRHQHGSANEYPTHPYPSYPYKKSSRKTTWNSEVWRARRPEELKGASPHTAVIYYLLFSVWLMLIAALIYAHCSVPANFLPVPEKDAKSSSELLSIMDIVYSTDEECMYIEKYDSPSSLSRGAMESLFCSLNERDQFNFNYLSFGMKRGQIFSNLFFNESESTFNSIPATRLECEQNCDAYEEWITEDEMHRQSITFDELKRKFKTLKSTIAAYANETNSRCLANAQGSAPDVRLQRLFACFIEAQVEVQEGKQRSLAPVGSGATKCVVGGSFVYSGNRIIRRNPLDAVVVCASTNRSDFRGVPNLIAQHNDDVPFILVVAPDGARLVDTVAMDSLLEGYWKTSLIESSVDSIRSMGLPYVVKQENGSFQGYIDDMDPQGYDKTFWDQVRPNTPTEISFKRISQLTNSEKKLFKRSVLTMRSDMNGFKRIYFNGKRRISDKDTIKQGKIL